jgi:hypothetical protein
VSNKPQKLKDLFNDNTQQQKKPTNNKRPTPQQNQPQSSGDPLKPNFKPNPNRQNPNLNDVKPNTTTTTGSTIQKPEFRSNPNRQADNWNTPNDNKKRDGYQKPEFKSNTNKSNPELANQKPNPQSK